MKWLNLHVIFLVVPAFIISHTHQLEELSVDSVVGNMAYPLLTYNADAFIFHEPLNILGYQNREEFERRIVFLEDSLQQKFVLKCYGEDQKEEAVCEYLGSFIGTSVGVPMNKVKIIVDGLLLIELDNGTCLATLHTYAPGKELCKWYETPPNDIILQGGLISERHLKCLAISNDLCDIIALDIFLNNRDRHHENCFFDEKAMRYYAIDMGDIFLAARKFPNCENSMSVELSETLTQLIAQEKMVACDTYNFLSDLDIPILSHEQKKSLKRVCFTLEKLMLLYPLETFLCMWLPLAEEVDYVYTEYKKNYLRLFLERNMYWVRKVIERMNELIKDEDMTKK